MQEKPAERKPWLQQIYELLISAIAYLLIAFIVYGLIIGTTLPWLHSLFLIRTDGVVVSASTNSFSVSGQSGGIPYTSDPMFEPEIEFVYVVNGEKITSNRFALSGASYDLPEAQAIASRYAIGQTVTVWYSAIDNSYAVIDPHPSYVKSLFGFLLLIVIGASIWKIVFVDVVRGRTSLMKRGWK